MVTPPIAKSEAFANFGIFSDLNVMLLKIFLLFSAFFKSVICWTKEDISFLASLADKEANPLYPVPVLWNKKELEKIYFRVSK